MSRDVWAVFPGAQRALFKTTLDRLRTACAQRGWRIEEVRTNPINLRSGLLNLVAPDKAETIYRRAHRARTVVVALRAAQVCLASEASLRLGLGSAAAALVPLKRFVRYKAFFVDLQTGGDPLRWTGAFDDWCEAVQCGDDYDPRCLPFHIFRTHITELDAAEQRASFDRHHGHATSRWDSERRRWALDPHSYHGRESVSVAGHPLPAGYHWDMTPEEGSTTRVRTPTAEWSVEGYINIYPDGGVRVTQKGRVRQVR